MGVTDKCLLLFFGHIIALIKNCIETVFSSTCKHTHFYAVTQKVSDLVEFYRSLGFCQAQKLEPEEIIGNWGITKTGHQRIGGHEEISRIFYIKRCRGKMTMTEMTVTMRDTRI